MSSGPRSGSHGGSHPVYLSSPVKAFEGGQGGVFETALAGSLALLAACGDDPPQMLLLGSAHPFEFGGLTGPEIADRVASALRECGRPVPVEFLVREGVYVREAALAASSSGADLFHEAALRVARGERRSIGVVGFEQMRLKDREARTAILRSLIHEEERRAGITMPALGALFQSYAETRVPDLDAALRAIIFQNRANAVGNPRAHIRKVFQPEDYEGDRNPFVSEPLRLWGVAPTSSGWAALRLGRERPAGPAASPARAVRVAGIGQGIDRVAVSAREGFLRSRATRLAMENLPTCTGLTRETIRRGLAYAEIHDAFPIIEFQGLIDTGILEESNAAAGILAGAIGPNGPVPVNLSGGVMGGHPVGATGVGQIVELVLQGMGLAETRGEWPSHHLSLALSVGGPATYNSVTLLQVSDDPTDEIAATIDLPRRYTRADFDLSLRGGGRHGVAVVARAGDPAAADGAGHDGARPGGPRNGEAKSGEPEIGRVIGTTRLYHPPAEFPNPLDVVLVETKRRRYFAWPATSDLRVGDRVVPVEDPGARGGPQGSGRGAAVDVVRPNP